ncbi:unnamed protein product [Merluccius merluccius]
MPQHCVLGCDHDDHERRSYFKFPLHDPERLQQWLRNMGRVGWAPSPHQYVCHQHFTESCFRVSLGTRSLEDDAVPTVFRASEKRKDVEVPGEKTSKYRRSNRNQRIPLPGLVENAERDGAADTPHFNVDASRSKATLLVESRDYMESLGGFKNEPEAAAAAETFDAGVDIHGVLHHAAEGLTVDCLQGDAEVLLVSDFPGVDVQEQLASGFANGHKLLITDSTLAQIKESYPCLAIEHVVAAAAGAEDGASQVIAYFETVPDVLPPVASQLRPPPPDTVLSSALGFKPIASTVPIVSKYVPPLPAFLATGVEKIDPDGDDGEEPDVDCSVKEKQLEEHCYFRRLSKEQLEVVVSELQKKVKVLRKRHRRHLEKLLGLESTVGQLRQDNLLHDERLQLLEKVVLSSRLEVTCLQ